MTADFTVAGYKALLEEFLKRGYQVKRFADSEPDRKHLVLRHDLDMSVQAALPIARVERELNVVATYFVLMRSEMYNPLSLRSLRTLGDLAKLGHETGVHLDASLYGDDIAALDQVAARECIALETLTGQPVKILSFHRPAPSVQGLDRTIAGRHHTYEPKYFHEMGYCSDSRGGWHHGHPLEHLAVTEGRALQLLTHPIWWNAGPGESAREKLDRFATDRFDLLRAELARNCEVYPQEYRALAPESS